MPDEDELLLSDPEENDTSNTEYLPDEMGSELPDFEFTPPAPRSASDTGREADA